MAQGVLNTSTSLNAFLINAFKYIDAQKLLKDFSIKHFEDQFLIMTFYGIPNDLKNFINKMTKKKLFYLNIEKFSKFEYVSENSP